MIEHSTKVRLLPLHNNKSKEKGRMKLLGVKILVGVAALSSGIAAYSFTNNRSNFLAKGESVAAPAAATAAASTSLPKSTITNETDEGSNSSDPYADYVTTESGLKYKVTREGGGAQPNPGQTVKTEYTGWLEGFNSRKKFDSSRDRIKPFVFKAGAGQVIRGWDESFLDMKVGERRNIIIPPSLGYGDRGAGGIIPGGATLYFDVELLNIQ
jgi:peptidylprolyl isomerase